jgi:hypothetical protein
MGVVQQTTGVGCVLVNWLAHLHAYRVVGWFMIVVLLHRTGTLRINCAGYGVVYTIHEIYSHVSDLYRMERRQCLI